MKRRSHKNTRRLTAKERAESFFKHPRYAIDDGVVILERIIQAHAREAVARYKRKHHQDSVLLRPFTPTVIDDSRPLFSARRKKAKR